MTPLEQAQALLGEHMKNYVIIVQQDEDFHNFELVYSDGFATLGLLGEASKYHNAVMSTYRCPEDAFEWEDLEDEEEEEDDEKYL